VREREKGAEPFPFSLSLSRGLPPYPSSTSVDKGGVDI
jgi:hypothetical protein